MTDVWRLVVDVFSFGWVPAWVWWVAGMWLLLSWPVGVVVGRVIRNRDRHG